MITILPVVFFSGGVPLQGRIYRNTPTLHEVQPVVLVTGSWLTVKEQMPHVYAQGLAERGFTAFTFDFTGFGQSQGEPRQAEIPARKITDLRSAVDFVRTLGFVDPQAIGLLAICASAQYSLLAIAEGLPIHSFVSVAGWYHTPDTIGSLYGGPEAVAGKLRKAAEAVEHYQQGGKVDVVPAYGPNNPDAGMPVKLDYYGNRSRGAIPEWKNEMAAMSWLYWLGFDGVRAADRVHAPTLMVHSDQAALPDNAKLVFENLAGLKELVWLEGAQIDFYDQPQLVSPALSAAEQHFRKTLPSRNERTDASGPDAVVATLLEAIDGVDWTRVRSVFADKIRVDYRSMNGVPAADLPADQLIEAWRKLVPGFDATQHLIGGTRSSVLGTEATVETHVRATHLIREDNAAKEWTVAGHYSFQLVRSAGVWKISAVKLDVFFQEGDPELPKVALARAAKSPRTAARAA